MNTTYPNIKKQKGVSIVAAVFLMVILALMGQGMVSLLTTSQQSTSHEVTSAKAYMAARSCLEWSMYQAVFTTPVVGVKNTTNTFNDSNSNLFNNICTTDVTTIIIDTHTIYHINVIAEFGSSANPEYSRREMHLQFQLL